MKDELKGFWIFKSHKYSSKEIFKSPQFNRIESISGKIADDITNWQKNGKLDIATRNVYNVNRDLLENRIRKLEDEIERREPTWWDKVKDFFRYFINFIMTILPRLVFKLLSNVAEGKGILAEPAKKLLQMTKKFQKALISKDKIYITET
jgi:hypothetical protein